MNIKAIIDTENNIITLKKGNSELNTFSFIPMKLEQYFSHELEKDVFLRWNDGEYELFMTTDGFYFNKLKADMI